LFAVWALQAAISGPTGRLAGPQLAQAGADRVEAACVDAAHVSEVAARGRWPHTTLASIWAVSAARSAVVGGDERAPSG